MCIFCIKRSSVVKDIRLTVFLSRFHTLKSECGSVISAYIHDKRIRNLCRTQFRLKDLFDHAYWHEGAVFETPAQLMDQLTADFIKNGICDERLKSDICERESRISFAYRQSVLFMHSFAPASETRLSITILKHRISFGDYRIRIAIMAVFAQGEYDLIVPMFYHFYTQKSDPDTLRAISSREEVEAFYLT